MKTSHLNFELLYANQARKEITINEALIKIDALLNCGAITMNLNKPPSSPTDGDVYIISSNPIDEWENKQNHIACYYNQWLFIKPNIGSLMWVNDEENIFYYNHNKWNPYR